MKERKERRDVEMDSEEKRKELSVGGTGVVRKIGKNKKSTPVGQKLNLTRVRMNYLRWQVR
jgi:hypothetical protein